VKIRPIRTAHDHARAMKRMAAIFDATPGTPEGDELDVLTTLVAAYERGAVRLPSAVEAIRFRLQQAGLPNRALEPILGSRSRVSEILSGERTLTADMMRALHLQFGIPAEALLGAAEAPRPRKKIEPSARALTELAATGLMKAREDFADFMARALTCMSAGSAHGMAHLRKSRTERTNAKTDTAALQGWCAAALLRSMDVKIPRKAVGTKINRATGREIATLSTRKDGLRRVQKRLADLGVALVLLRHLRGTYLDGAAMRRADGVNVIALTLRYDRLDNFWFTLLHELAHVACHLDGDTSMIFDDLELGSSDRIEAEADEFAQEALIPKSAWKRVSEDFGVSIPPSLLEGGSDSSKITDGSQSSSGTVR
jgi:HTH-type transcriptional regulator / antitoxin HigA